MANKEKICLPCEREKAKLPTFRNLAKQRAVRENKIIIVYFDDEDSKYKTMDYELALSRGVTIAEYFTPL